MDGRKEIGTTERYLSEKGAKHLKGCVVPAQSVTVSCIGWQMGKAALLPKTSVTNQQLNTIIPNELADPHYLYYHLTTRRDELKQLGSVGTRTPIVNKSAFSALKIQFPNLEEQRRIAGILTAYDELIENCRRRIQILEEMARSLYREWFVHFRYPGHESVPLVPSPLGPIPGGWEVRNLGSLIESHIGGGWGKEESDYLHTEPAYVIRGTDVPGARYGDVEHVPFRYHSLSNIKSRRLDKGDIVFEVSGGSKGQPVGRSLVITEEHFMEFGGQDVICASFCKRVVPNSHYGSEALWLSFLEGYENGEIERFQVQSTGISNFKWTEYLNQMSRIVPPPELVPLFEHRVRPLIKSIGVLGRKLSNLRHTRDFLLPKLLTNEYDSGQLTGQAADAINSAELQRI